MKKNILAVILIVFAFVSVYAQSDQIDLILLLDTSAGMAGSYDNVNNYITGGFLTEFLRVGDTFHLIAFSQNQRLDVARRIASIGDMETIIGRMLLQYPVENGNDLSSALAYTEQYITTLPSRPKKIVIVSIGTGDTNNLVSSARQRLNSRNTTIDFVQVTPGQAITNVPRSGRPAAVTGRTAATTSSAGTATTSAAGTATTGTTGTAATGTTAAQTGTRAAGTDSSGAATDRSSPDTVSRDEIDSIFLGTEYDPSRRTTDTQSEQTYETTDTAAEAGLPGLSDSSGLPDFSDTQRSSQDGAMRPERLRASSSWLSSLPFIIGLIILLLLLLGLIIFLVSRRLGSSPNRVMAEVSTSGQKYAPRQSYKEEKFADHSKDLASYAAAQSRRVTPYSDRPKPEVVKSTVINATGPLLLNLFVEDQNTAIGKRNIHSLKSGYRFSIGGGKSDFLIFLVPIPPNIGEVRRNGSQLTFTPKKPKYFPDLGSNELRDCLNKTIRIISDKNYELRFRFEMYEDPLIALNRMLTSIKVPG